MSNEKLKYRTGSRGKYSPTGTTISYVCELIKDLSKDSNLAYVNLLDENDKIILENISVSRDKIVFD